MAASPTIPGARGHEIRDWSAARRARPLRDREIGAALAARGGPPARPASPPVLIDGAPHAEIDIPFERRRYGVEVDGPHHLLPDVAAADRQRDRKLEHVHWKIDRFLWFEIEDRGQWFVQQVSRRLQRLGA